MRCSWWVLSVMVCMACSDRGVRSGTPQEADFLPMVADTADPGPGLVVDADTLGLGDGDAPRLVLRCEAGRLDAYVVLGTPAEVESGQIDDRAVPVLLDSTPSC